MDVRILGPLVVRTDGRDLDLGGPRPRSLFAILLLRRGEVVPAERLVDEIWGEAPPRSARHLLHVYVSALRKQVGPALVTRAPGYLLQLEPDEVDALRFEHLLTQGRGLLATGDPERACSTLCEALALWHGPALADFAYEQFAQREIARLEELRLAALEERIEADLALGRNGELVGELEVLIAEQPLRQRLRRQLVLALHRSGRPADALSTYEEARRLLDEELGLEPSEELQKLEREIRKHKPSSRDVRKTRRLKLLEREPLLDRLEELLAEIRLTHGRLALVAGEAGIGKTALVEAFCSERVDGLRVMSGVCDAVVPARPFAPLSDIAARVGGSLRAALEAGDRDRVLNAFLDLLRKPGAAPALVVFDDLHWADDATLDLIRVVGRRLVDLPVLIIGNYRDHEVGSDHPLRLALGDLPSGIVHELRVPPLSVTAVETLCAAAADHIDSVALHAATAGNPFFVTEAIATAGDDLPASVRDAVFARVARLSPSAQHVLKAASVLGQTCERELLDEVADRDPAALDECLARGLLQLNTGVVRFRHELAQRAVREGLAPAEGAAFHGRALSALRRMTAADPARLAHHAVASADVDAVLEWGPVAAERAAALGAHREAAAHYAHVLRFARELDDASRAELLEGHAAESFTTDEVERAISSQEEALACWHRMGDIRREGRCLTALSLMLWYAAEYDRAVEASEQAVVRLESQDQPGPELAHAYSMLALRYLIRGHDDGLRAASYGERALELAERLGDEPVAVHALTTMGLDEICRGSETGWAKLEESLRRAKAAGLEEAAARALVNLVEVPEPTTRYVFADRYRDEAIAFMTDESPDLDLYRRRLHAQLAETALERGHWDEAAGLVDALLAERRTASLTRMKALTVLGKLRARRGDPDVWSPLDEGLELAGPHAEDQDVCPLNAARAEAAWLEGDTSSARAEAEAGLALQEEWNPWVLGELGFWAWKAGSLRQLPAASARPYLLHSGGRYREAASAWKAIGCPYQQAFALAESDDEDDLRRALAILHSLGAGPMARTVTKQLRAIGARSIPRGPRPYTRRNPARLTTREVEVLALLGEGMRNADIARRLVVSAKTVDHHVSAILRKLGAPNRAAAVEEAARLGLQDRQAVTAR